MREYEKALHMYAKSVCAAVERIGYGGCADAPHSIRCSNFLITAAGHYVGVLDGGEEGLEENSATRNLSEQQIRRIRKGYLFNSCYGCPIVALYRVIYLNVLLHRALPGWYEQSATTKTRATVIMDIVEQFVADTQLGLHRALRCYDAAVAVDMRNDGIDTHEPFPECERDHLTALKFFAFCASNCARLAAVPPEKDDRCHFMAVPKVFFACWDILNTVQHAAQAYLNERNDEWGHMYGPKAARSLRREHRKLVKFCAAYADHWLFEKVTSHMKVDARMYAKVA